MKLFVKFIVGIVSIAATVVVTIVSGIEWAERRIDHKLAITERHHRETVLEWRSKTRADIISGDEILSARIVGVENTMNSIDKNVRVLLRIQLRKEAFKSTEPESLYTKTRNFKKVDTI